MIARRTHLPLARSSPTPPSSPCYIHTYAWHTFLPQQTKQHLGYKRSDQKSSPADQMPKPVAAPVEKVAMGRRRLVQVADDEDELPSEVDWVESGAVSPVQNQVRHSTLQIRQ